jgi:hypothetical protein
MEKISIFHPENKRKRLNNVFGGHENRKLSVSTDLSVLPTADWSFNESNQRASN